MARAEKGKAVFLLARNDITNDQTLINAGLSGIRLPVAPLDTINVQQGTNVNNNNVPASGSVVFGGGPGLITISFDSLLPLEANPVYGHTATAQHPYQDPNWYDALLKRLASQNTIFRLVVSEPTAVGSYTNDASANRLVYDHLTMITQYSVNDEEGDCLWYSIAFSEYRELAFSLVRRDIGPYTYVVNRKDLQTPARIARYYKRYGVTYQTILRLNKNMKQPHKKGKKPKKVTNQNQRIKMGTKIKLRAQDGSLFSPISGADNLDENA